jgi:uncharacterized membrane protein (DUF106 family)
MIHLITEEANDIHRAQLVSQRFPELEPDTHPALTVWVVAAIFGVVFWSGVAVMVL